MENEENFTFDDILILPGKSTIPLEKDDQIDISSHLTKKIVLKIPIVSAPMKSITDWRMAAELAKRGGIGIIHSFMSRTEQLYQVAKVKERKQLVGAAVYDGWPDLIEHMQRLVSVNIDVVVVDTYHAYNTHTLRIVKKIKQIFPQLELIVGNVVTKEGVIGLCKAGADAIKVGIGPGSHCTTRLVTGCGRPQLSAIFECSKAAQKYNVPIIADGGIKNSGDIVKALVFGADTVMLGGLFSGYEESPGDIILKNGLKFKNTSGNCTRASVFSLHKKALVRHILQSLIAVFKSSSSPSSFFLEEGVGGMVPYKGPVNPFLTILERAIKRSFWYVGVKNIKELRKKAKVVRTSLSSFEENRPHLFKCEK